METSIDYLCKTFSVSSSDDLTKDKYGEALTFCSLEEECNHYESLYISYAERACKELKVLELNTPEEYIKEVDRINRVFNHVKEVLLPNIEESNPKKNAVKLTLKYLNDLIGKSPSIKGFKAYSKRQYNLRYDQFYRELSKSYISPLPNGKNLIKELLNEGDLYEPLNWLGKMNHLRFIIESLSMFAIEKVDLKNKTKELFTLDGEEITDSKWYGAFKRNKANNKKNPSSDELKKVYEIIGSLNSNIPIAELDPTK